MDACKTMLVLAELPQILEAAQVLQRNGLLADGETAADVVKRYVAAHPEINAALARSA